MDNPQWKFPDNFLAAFRCTEVRYAESFIENGIIKFNTPNSWVKYAKEQTEGRGDLLEGTIAAYSNNDIASMIKLNNEYSKYDLIREFVKDKVYLKLKRSMELPCYCFYRLKMDMFQCPGAIGENTIECEIPAKYFRDFSNQMSVEQINTLPPDQRPSIIMIENYNEFQNRVMKALQSLGVKK